MRSLSLLLLLLVVPARSHPGIGIVRDSRGNVFYTDLRQVWRIAPDGSRTVAVRNVHTHELYIDAQDNLYGEHLWYEGERTDRWGHRVWRLSRDGVLTDVIPARQGFREDYGDFFFVRDPAGAMYWADRGETTTIRKRTPAGVNTVIVRSTFENVRWMTVSPAGVVFVIDLFHLLRISASGEITTLARNLASRRSVFLFFKDTHAIMGLWTDNAENVFVAVSSDKSVKKVSPKGNVDVVYRSNGMWAPTGGLIAPDGVMWVLESGNGNAVRVTRVDLGGKETIFE